jgi:hypothetical protein
MKVKHILLVLFVMSFFSSCADQGNSIISDENDEPAIENLPSINYEDNELDGSVAYRRCAGGEENQLMGIQFQKGEAYYFKDFIPAQMKTELTKCWVILFDSAKEEVHITCDDKSLYGLPIWGMICNFPDFAKAWDIPENGCKVIFTGITYLPTWGGTANQILMDYVLTTLAREDYE